MQHKKNKNIKQLLIKKREILITSVIIFLCLLLAFLFPSKNIAQTITSAILFLIVVPILYYKLILHKKLSSLGLKMSDKKKGLFWGILMLIVNLIVFFLLFTFTSFKENYLLSPYIINSFWIFLIYELILVNAFIFIQEFFWRGFILLYFSKKIGYLAIFLQFIIYVLILILGKSSFWQSTPMLVISLTSGIIVYKNKSILYSWITAVFSILILDSFIIYHLK